MDFSRILAIRRGFKLSQSHSPLSCWSIIWYLADHLRVYPPSGLSRTPSLPIYQRTLGYMIIIVNRLSPWLQPLPYWSWWAMWVGGLMSYLGSALSTPSIRSVTLSALLYRMRWLCDKNCFPQGSTSGERITHGRQVGGVSSELI